jgi:hypothetical protein
MVLPSTNPSCIPIKFNCGRTFFSCAFWFLFVPRAISVQVGCRIHRHNNHINSFGMFAWRDHHINPWVDEQRSTDTTTIRTIKTSGSSASSSSSIMSPRSVKSHTFDDNDDYNSLQTTMGFRKVTSSNANTLNNKRFVEPASNSHGILKQIPSFPVMMGKSKCSS